MVSTLLPLASVPVACVDMAIFVLMSVLNIVHGCQATSSSQLVPFFIAWQLSTYSGSINGLGHAPAEIVHGASPAGEFENIEMARVQFGRQPTTHERILNMQQAWRIKASSAPVLW